MTPRDREKLEAIAESARKIGDYVNQAGPTWPEDDMAVDAIAKRLEQIGELAKRLSFDVLERMPNVDWKGVKAIREILVHEYEDVQIDVLEDVLENELPGLLRAIESVLSDPKAS
jgi:uncharacterized protein with HEPN domain